MARDKECLYCKAVLSCRNGKEVGTYCVNFIPRNEEQEKEYKEWREEQSARTNRHI